MLTEGLKKRKDINIIILLSVCIDCDKINGFERRFVDVYEKVSIQIFFVCLIVRFSSLFFCRWLFRSVCNL